MMNTSFRKTMRVAAGARGVTLIEILIVLTIVGLMAGGVVAFLFPKLAKAKIDTSITNCRATRPLAESWRADHPGECPTMEKLKADKAIDPAANIKDPWGKTFVIHCEGDEVRVASFGPDGKEGTADDISVPAEAGKEGQ
jgi:general secretion pathway protein G